MFYPVSTVRANAESAEPSTEQQLNITSLALVKDSTYRLNVYNLSSRQKIFYKSSASSVVQVNKEGLLTACKYGTATITATVKEGLKTIATLQCDVIVGPAAVSIKFTEDCITLSVGDKYFLSPILKPNNTVETPIYTSSDPDIVIVNSNGRIIAKEVGQAEIKASISGDDKSDTCKVIVTPTTSSSNRLKAK